MSLRKKLKLNSEDTNEYDGIAESKYFLPTSMQFDTDTIPNSLLNIENKLISKLKNLTFQKPVECVYSPLDYASITHSMFVNKYCTKPKKILFLGLNPGPWGMGQTGVPFGEVNITKDWLQIEGPVEKPANEISIRPVCGFNCHRSEISGKKFWSFFQDLCGSPDTFFKYSYMHNYCPLLLMKNTGANVTPADLKSTNAVELLKYCDESLSEILKLLQTEIVIAVGRFTQKRTEETLKAYGLNNIRVVFLVHPSPRIPLNENWNEKAKKTLTDLDLLKYFNSQDNFTNSGDTYSFTNAPTTFYC